MKILLCVTRRIQKSRNDEPLAFNPFAAAEGDFRKLRLIITLKLSLRCWQAGGLSTREGMNILKAPPVKHVSDWVFFWCNETFFLCQLHFPISSPDLIEPLLDSITILAHSKSKILIIITIKQEINRRMSSINRHVDTPAIWPVFDLSSPAPIDRGGVWICFYSLLPCDRFM